MCTKNSINVVLGFLSLLFVSIFEVKAQHRINKDRHVLIEKYKDRFTEFWHSIGDGPYKMDYNYYVNKELEIYPDTVLLVSFKINRDVTDGRWMKFWGILTNQECLLFYFDSSFNEIPRQLPNNVTKYEKTLLEYLKKFGDPYPDKIILMPNKP